MKINKYKDGKETNPAISNILGNKPVYDTEIEIQYQKYCEQIRFYSMGKGSLGVQRKFGHPLSYRRESLRTKI